MSRKVNGLELSNDITLHAYDVGALPASQESGYYSVFDNIISDASIYAQAIGCTEAFSTKTGLYNNEAGLFLKGYSDRVTYSQFKNYTSTGWNAPTYPSKTLAFRTSILQLCITCEPANSSYNQTGAGGEILTLRYLIPYQPNSAPQINITGSKLKNFLMGSSICPYIDNKLPLSASITELQTGDFITGSFRKSWASFQNELKALQYISLDTASTDAITFTYGMYGSGPMNVWNSSAFYPNYASYWVMNIQD